MMPENFSAVVLAAGRSSRMGRDKALLSDSEGVLLWERQRGVLARAGATEIFISARSDQAWATAAVAAKSFADVVPDAIPEGGPLAGIVAAGERAAHSHLAVLAVDLSRMEPAWFASLAAECRAGCGVVGRRIGADNFFEPLAAIYPRELLPLAREALAKRELSLQRLIATACAEGMLRVREISAVELPLFENWNESPR